MVKPGLNERREAAAEQVEQFVRRFEPSYRLLACHASLPLVLTPELLHYLRNQFVREAPWVAEVDLLLSDLCSPVGYELYAMESPIRAYLLEQMQQEAGYGKTRMREVAQVLYSYVRYLSLSQPQRRQSELDAQRWAAMAYLGDERCREAAAEIAARLQQGESGSERGMRPQLAWLTKITQELAIQFEAADAGSLVNYATVVQQVLKTPANVDVADLRRSYVVGNVSLQIPQSLVPEEIRLVATGEGRVLMTALPALQDFEFDVATILVGEDQTSSRTQPLELQPFKFEVAVIQQLIFEREDLEQFVGKEIGFSSSSQQLSDLKRGILNGALRGWTYSKIAESNNVEVDHVKSTAVELWGQLSEVFGAKINKTGLRSKLTQIAIRERGIQRESRTGQQAIERLNNQISLELVSIPGGSFSMGSPDDELERLDTEGPQHLVTIQPFLMGKYPITQAQWRTVANFPQVNRSLEPEPSHFKGEALPVEQVSWDDALEFCERLSRYTGREYRLPSEAEWEYACRARTITPFYFGETISTEVANYCGEDRTIDEKFYSGSYGPGVKGIYRKETTNVGEFPANVFGLYDMHGNVWEWCEDHWHSSYKGAPIDGSAWIDQEVGEDKNRVLRGGSWVYNPRFCRSATRDFVDAGIRDYVSGFRVVCLASRTL